MEQGQVIDTFGEIIAALATFAGKVPAQSFMAMPQGIRPTLEAVESYEEICQSEAPGIFAAEQVRLYDAIQTLRCSSAASSCRVARRRRALVAAGGATAIASVGRRPGGPHRRRSPRDAAFHGSRQLHCAGW